MEGKNTYYLYIDDSGKFNTSSDKHIIYSFLLFDVDKNKEFNKRANKCKEALYATKEELHGNAFIKRLNKLKKDPLKKANFEELISCYGCSIITGSVIWCKNESKAPTDYLNFDQEFYKKARMISIIIKKINEKKFARDNSNFHLYIDNEKIKKDEYPDRLKKILNEDYSKFSGDIKYLRVHNIFVENIEYLDSKESIGIQFADIIANVTYKKYNNESNKIKLFFELFHHYSETIYCIFPKYKYNYNINELECICLETSHRN